MALVSRTRSMMIVNSAGPLGFLVEEDDVWRLAPLLATWVGVWSSPNVLPRADPGRLAD
jgi:hypothetical protein